MLTCWLGVTLTHIFHRISSGLWTTRSPLPHIWAQASTLTFPCSILSATSGLQHCIATSVMYPLCPPLLAPRAISQALIDSIPYAQQSPISSQDFQVSCSATHTGPFDWCPLLSPIIVMTSCSPRSVLSHAGDYADLPGTMDMPYSSHPTYRPLAYAPCR